MKFNVNKALKAIFSDKGLQADIMELNTQFQLFNKGIDSEGVSLASIGGGYSENTLYGGFKYGEKYEGKIAKGLPTEWVTLYNEGDFYASWQFVNGDTFIEFKARTKFPGDDGQVDLEARWGNKIVGLTDESLQLVIEWATDAFKRVFLHYMETGDYEVRVPMRVRRPIGSGSGQTA